MSPFVIFLVVLALVTGGGVAALIGGMWLYQQTFKRW